MDDARRALLDFIYDGVFEVFDGPRETLRGPLWLYDLTSQLGWQLDRLDEEHFTTWLDALGSIDRGLVDAQASIDQADDLDAALLQIGQAIADASRRLADVDLARTCSTAPIVNPQVVASLARDLVEWMVLTAIERRWPALHGLGVMLGLIAREETSTLWAEGCEVPASEGDPILRYPAFRSAFQSSRLQGFVQAPLALLARVIARVEASNAAASDPQTMLAALADALTDELELVVHALRRDAADHFHLQLDPAGIELRAPLLALTDTPPIVLPLSLPSDVIDRLELSVVHDGRLRLEWKGLLAGDEPGDLRLLEFGGFTLGLAAGAGNALILRSDAGVPVLELHARVAIELPTDLVAGLEGGRLRAEGGATLIHREGRLRLILQPLSLALIEPLRIGGPEGLVIRDASLTIGEFELSSELALDPGRLPLSLALQGELSLLDGDLIVGIEAEYADRRWRLASRATLQLPNGVVLEPIDEQPVLELELELGTASGELEFAAAGRVRFPAAGDSEGALELRGALTLLVSRDGVELQRLRMAARQDHWPLGEDLVIDDFGLALEFDGARIVAKPSGVIAIGEDFELALLDAPPPALASALAGRELGLRLTPAPGRLDGELTCAMRLRVSPSLLSGGETGDDAVTIELAATLGFSSDPDRAPALSDLAFRLGVERLHLGGKGGLIIESAELRATSIERLLALGRAPHPTLEFGGTLRCPVDDSEGTIDLTLEGARFVFERADGRPRFEFADGGKLGFAAANVAGLPIRITEGSIGLREGNLALTDLLRPENLILEASAALDLEFVDTATLVGSIEGVRAEIRGGRPCLSFTGASVGVENLEFPPMTLSGALGLHGIDDPLDIQLEGVLGGSASGAGVKALVAIKLCNGVPTPLGVCLDVSLGASGIPLGYGFIVIGAAGGISFANTNGDPCEFATYASARQPIRSGRRVASSRAVGCAGCPCDCPPPSLNLLCQPHPDQERYSGRVILKFSAIDEPTWSTLPVIDAEGRQSTLGSWLHERDAELDARLASLDPALESERITDVVMSSASAWIEAAIPKLDPGAVGPKPALPHLAPILAAPAQHWAAQARLWLRTSLELALRRAQNEALAISIHALVGEALERGVNCPDQTLQVTGTFSYTGVSMFLSVTGGVNVGSTGTVGVLGYLNVFGVPLGQLRAFVTVTSDVGTPEPSLCGDLRFEFGPLALGQIGFVYRCPGCVTNVAATLAKFAVALGEPLLARMLARIERPEARFVARTGVALTSDPKAALGHLTGPEASALLGQLIADLPELAASEAEQVVGVLGRLVAELWAGFQPEVVLCGKVAPKLFGLPLGGELVEARGKLGKDRFDLEFGFSPLYLLGRICPIADMCSGMDTASLGVGMSWPTPEQVLIDGLTGHVANQAEFERLVDQGLARILHDASLVFSYRFFPLGMKLVDGQGRVVMPYLTPHPDGHASSWVNPDERIGWRTRREVLFAALDRAKLADVGWSGRIADVIEVGSAGESIELQRDYFPHGGLIGASRLTVPRLLWDAPPLGLLTQIGSAPQWRDRAQAMITLIREWVLATREAGTLSFYVPAPSPPGPLRDAPSENLRRTIDSLLDLDLSHLREGDRMVASELYRLDLAFFEGVLQGRLLGLEVGTARIVFEPPSVAGGASELRVRVEAAGDPRLRAWVREGRLDVVLSNPPADRVLAPPERKTIDDVFAPLLASLQATSTSASLVGSSLGARVQLGKPAPVGPTPAVLGQVVDAFARHLPKLAATGEVALQVPADLREFVEATGRAELRLYSPFYDPSAVGETLDARARRGGGLVVRAAMAFKLGTLWRFESTVELSLAPGELATRARLEGRLMIGTVANLSILAASLPLANTELRFDSDPPANQPILALRGTLGTLQLGQLELSAIEGGPLQLAVEASRIDHTIALALRLPACRVRWPGIGPTGLELSGGTVGTKGGSLSVVAPPQLELSANGVVLLKITGSGTGTLQLAAKISTASLTFAAGVALDVLPGDPQLRRRITLASSLSVSLASDGRFSASFELPALVVDGLFTIEGSNAANASVGVRLDDEGLHLAAPANLVVTLPGVARQTARLDTLDIGHDLAVVGAGSGATLRVPGICTAGASAFGFVRIGSQFRLTLTDTQIGFDALPELTARWSLALGPGLIAAEHRSGATSLRFGSGLLIVDASWSVSGSNFSSLTLHGKLRTASVFDMPLIATKLDFDLALGSTGTVTGELAVHGDLAVIPNLLTLSIAGLGIVDPTQVELRGRLRAFPRAAQAWLVDVGLETRIGAAPSSAPALAKPAAIGVVTSTKIVPRFDAPALARDSKLFDRAGLSLTADLGFGRDANGFYLALGSLRAAWAGVELATSERKLRAPGPIGVEWTNTRSWATSPVQLEIPSGNATIDLANATATCTLNPGTLKLAGPGWPSLTASTARLELRWTGALVTATTTRLSFASNESSWQVRSPVRWRIEGPRFDVDLALGERLGVRCWLRGGRVTVESSASRPDGKPWAEANAAMSDTEVVGAEVSLDLPALPDVGDPLAGARSVCENAAKLLPPPQRPNCSALHPKPPSLAFKGLTVKVSLASVFTPKT
ncbi:hypothetical protein ACNOYE_32795 [Nannocystaceae bacterium ST9]